MNNPIENKTIKDILRPPIIPERNKAFFLSILIFGMLWLIIGLIFQNRVMMVTLLILLLFPLILLLRLFWYFTRWVIICEEKLIINDYSFTSYPAYDMHQEICFEDIDYVYYAEKEYRLLRNYRHKLRKYKIHANEMDYRKENLVDKYKVPTEVINKFECNLQNALDDYTATGILMSLETILDKYAIPKVDKKKILKELKITHNFDFEKVTSLLSPFHISLEELDDLKDEFSNADVKIVSPFLLTELNVEQVEKSENSGNNISVIVSVNKTIVLSNRDGTKKVYLSFFHSLRRADWQKLIHVINQNKSTVKYLMTRRSYENISDPNFKPGCG